MNILVVEDESKLASFLKSGFEEEQFNVDLADNGEDAVLKAINFTYDLILMDLMLPQKDGLTAISEIREKEILTPILCLTAKNTLDDVVSGLNSGSDGYLTKPFFLPELIARSRALIRRKTNPHTELFFADLRLDPAKHKAWRSNQTLSLSAKEYALLEYLMLNPNQVLSRAMIAENVWGAIYNSSTNIVDVYINYLRNKIDRNFKQKLVHTVRGSGYVLKAEG